MSDINVTFTDTSDSHNVKRATLSPDVTPAFCLAKLVDDGFMPAPSPGAHYSLVTPNGTSLQPNVTLADAGITGDTTLAVTHEHQGA